jgi:DegV family protein with EDD domain
MINILTDSTADLPDTLIDAFQIGVLPMYVQIDGKTYRDGINISAQKLFERVNETGQYPTTSAPSPLDFEKFFNQKDPSIYIGVSSVLSSTFRNAQFALKDLGSKLIDLIDSRSISTGYGQIVLQAAEWRNAGMSFEELQVKIRQLVHKARGIFILDSLDYLYHGGRCSAVEHIFSSILKIRPILNILPNGTLGVLQKIRGSREKAVDALWNYFKTQIHTLDLKRIFLMHIDSDDEINYLRERISNSGIPVQVEIGRVGCVLATHSGPKPLGIAYTVK